jgi:hypothetical protein
MTALGPAPVGRKLIGNIPAAPAPCLLNHRDLGDQFRGVATHRLQVTVFVLALMARLSAWVSRFRVQATLLTDMVGPHGITEFAMKEGAMLREPLRE